MFLEPILQNLQHNLETEGLFRNSPRPHVLIAYSGGVDSTALLFAMAELQKKTPLTLTAAYFNHAWRGAPPEELSLIHQNCKRAGVPLILIQADKTLSKTETVAREHRYRQLTNLAHDLKADAVLTAHHADDQIETILFRILRGTGVNGLTGIHRRLILEAPFGRPVPVMRPLIDTPKETLVSFVKEQNLSYFNDPTNADVKIQRNQIRNEILPYLESKFPQVKNALFRLGVVSEGDVEILEEKTEHIWQDTFSTDARGMLLNALLFNQLGIPYQRRVLKKFLGLHKIVTDFQEIDELLTFIRGEGRDNLATSLKSVQNSPDGKPRFLSLYKNQLRIIVPPEAREVKEAVPVTIPGESAVEALGLKLRTVPLTDEERKIRMTPIRAKDTHQVYVDLSRFADKPLELRTRKPGDKFKPMGMDVPMRFKKFLINRGIPRFERNNLLLLAHGKEILWAPGLGISQDLKVQQSATHLLKLEYDNEPERLTPVLMPEGIPRFNPNIPDDNRDDDDEDETGDDENRRPRGRSRDREEDDEEDMETSATAAGADDDADDDEYEGDDE